MPRDRVRVYIAGPMRGYPQMNRPTFTAAEVIILALGDRFEVENPARCPDMDGWGTEEYMARDLPLLRQCQWVALLPGWQRSEGARREFACAVAHGIPTVAITELERALDAVQEAKTSEPVS